MTSAQDQGPHPHYRFGDVVVDAAAHTLTVRGEAVSVEPKAYAVLLCLLEHAGELVGKDALLDAVWGHHHVTPGVLTRAIAQLRAALGDDSHAPRYIQTRHGVGYRFVGELDARPDRRRASPAGAAALAGDRVEGDAAAAPMPVESPRNARDGQDDDATGADVGDGALEVPHPHPPRHAQPTYLLLWLLPLLLLAAGLAWWRQQQATPIPRDASIAVLPFTSLSTDPDDAYFAEGLSIELHDALSGVPGLVVAAPLSPRDARRDGDLRQLGQDLGVAALLDASVRREGDRLRVNARLTDTATGYTLWSRRYDQPVAQVFDTQANIAEEVVGSMLGAMPNAQLDKRLAPTPSVAAFDAYLRGLAQLVDRAATGADDRATTQFKAALAADPGFARAQAGICRTSVNRFRTNRDPDAHAAARQACDRARRMDPALGEVSLALAELHQARGELDAAERLYRRAESDASRRPGAYVGLAYVAMERGETEQAMGMLQRALRLRPGDADVHANLGYLHYLAGRMPEAIAAYRRATGLAPGNASHWSTLGGLYLAEGQLDPAAVALEASIRVEPNYAAFSNLGELRFQQGRYREAAALQRRATALSPNDYLPWNNLGDALLAAGDRSGAREAYVEAMRQVERYLRADARNAKAVAALGWFRANLAQTGPSLEAARRSEDLGAEPAEVALYNAQTYARLGDTQQAARRLADAREAGMPESRIRANPFLVAGAAPDAQRAGASGRARRRDDHPAAGDTATDEGARRTD